MSTAELRRSLTEKNQTLQEQHERLKQKKADIVQHIGTIMRRCKQIEKMKVVLRDQLERAVANAKVSNNKKRAYVEHLGNEVKRIDGEVGIEVIQLKKLENEYELCLLDYDKVLKSITQEMESIKLLEADIKLQRQNNENIKTMIFDYERLKRVLSEQKQYFKELSLSEEKNHGERVKKLEQLLEELIKEGENKQVGLKLGKYRAGYLRMELMFRKKLRQYAEDFLRMDININNRIKIKIKTIQNCFELAHVKYQSLTRQIFHQWHSNAFPMDILKNLVEMAAWNDIASLRKLSVLNRMIQEVNGKNMEIFHLYEKGKYLKIIGNKIGRKDMQYGFGRWRKNCQFRTQKLSYLYKIIKVVVPNREKQVAFKLWRSNAIIDSRYLLANHLLTQYLNTRQLCRMFRKWRLTISDFELKDINQFIDVMKQKNKITRKINYEKRKAKAVMGFQLSLSKIKLRNYFNKYWANVKYMAIGRQKNEVKNEKQRFLEMKVEQKALVGRIEKLNEKLSLRVLRAFMLKGRLHPFITRWHNVTIIKRKQSHVVYHLAMKKQMKYKIYGMNRWQKWCLGAENGDIGEVLREVDGNREIVGQKGRYLREKLVEVKKVVRGVGARKMGELLKDSVLGLKRGYFHRELVRYVGREYKERIIDRVMKIMEIYFLKRCFGEIRIWAKEESKILRLQQILKQWNKNKVKKEQSRIFYALKLCLSTYKSSFTKIYQTLNAAASHRLVLGFSSIQRKAHAEQVRTFTKKLAHGQSVLKVKDTNIAMFHAQRVSISNQLSGMKVRLIKFMQCGFWVREGRTRRTAVIRYFTKYRQNIRYKIYMEGVLEHFSDFIRYKNQLIFWRGINVVVYENRIDGLREEVGALKKKKKICEEKQVKSIGDIDKKVSEVSMVYISKLQNYQHYENKFTSILTAYQQEYQERQNRRYLQSSFTTWKKQYQSVVRLINGVNIILQKNLVYWGFCLMVRKIEEESKRYRGGRLCGGVLLKRGRNQVKRFFMVWRVNSRKMEIRSLGERIKETVENREDVAEECKIKSKLIGQQRVRLRRTNTLSSCFMAIKAEYRDRVYYQHYKLQPFAQKWNELLLKKCISGLKWCIYYKKTKRAYLRYKNTRYQVQIKTKIFSELKKYRQNCYTFIDKIHKIVKNEIVYNLKKVFNKIINLGICRKNLVLYQHKKILRHLVMNKATKIRIVKIQIMAKWYSQLIPRQHYLCNILKSLETATLRRIFHKIHQYSCWHSTYIKKLSDRLTTDGYTSITATTNNLIKQGYDPQQIKEYLSINNQNDINKIRVAVMKIRSWGTKQYLVRGWNSWKQYIWLKKNIKKSLGNVLKKIQGLGKCWKRWRNTDPGFNAILAKESRGSMMERGRDLVRLMKQYKRDIKDSRKYCQQLKQVNDEYADGNTLATRMALTTFSLSVKKGLRQGLQIWLGRVQELHKQVLDGKYDQLSQGISVLLDKKNKLKYRIVAMKEEGIQLRLKCNLGKECGEILEKLMKQRDNLSIDLADKQHNLKLLLEDNLRLKQKIRSAKVNAQKLINRVQNIENYDY